MELHRATLHYADGNVIIRKPSGFNPNLMGAFAVFDKDGSFSVPPSAIETMGDGEFFCIMAVIQSIDGRECTPIYRVGLLCRTEPHPSKFVAKPDCAFNSETIDTARNFKHLSYIINHKVAYINAPFLEVYLERYFSVQFAVEFSTAETVRSQIFSGDTTGMLTKWHRKILSGSNAFYLLGAEMARRGVVPISETLGTSTTPVLGHVHRGVVNGVVSPPPSVLTSHPVEPKKDSSQRKVDENTLKEHWQVGKPKLPRGLKWGGSVGGIVWIKTDDEESGKRVYGWSDILAGYMDTIEKPAEMAEWLESQASKMEASARVARTIADALRSREKIDSPA